MSNEVMTTAEKVMESKAVIMKLYTDETDTRDWAVAFSGGKDSTAVMGLLVSTINMLPKEKRTRKVHAVMSNTLAENPLVHEHMMTQMDLINKYCKKHELPIDVNMVTRTDEHGFFYLLIGRGYPLPKRNGSGRWCTDRLKVKPQVAYLKEINPSYTLTGVRSSESVARSKNIEKFKISDFIGVNNNYEDSKTITPIVKWTVEDVWRYLEMEGLEWGSTLSVRTIYRDATGECGFSNPVGVEKKSVEVCGARHGCWNCPVILNDRSTEKMSEKHDWLEPLTEWRQTLMKVYGDYIPPKLDENQGRKERSQQLKEAREFMTVVKKITRAGYMRNGKQLKEGQGTLTLSARKYLYSELIDTEKLVNRIRKMHNMEPLTLISEQEKKLIKEAWKEDEKLSYMDIPNGAVKMKLLAKKF